MAQNLKFTVTDPVGDVYKRQVIGYHISVL